jgi:hypothetical protein
MPVKLQVPDIYIPPLGELVKLPPESMKALLQGLREEKPTLGLNDFADSIATRLSVDRATAQGIIELLASLHAVREGLGEDVSEFVSALRAAIEDTGKPELQPPDWSVFENTIAEAFSSESPLSISAKALDLLTDHQRVFFYARVLTDLRPVFKSEISGAPAALVAIHTLKLGYRAEGVPRDFYVALDSQDVKTLIEILQRAADKEKSLRDLAETKGLTLLEVKL